MTYSSNKETHQHQYSATTTMSKPTAGRSMLSALLASQSKTSQSPDFDATKTIITTTTTTTSDLESESNCNKVYDRTTKVAKTGYSDHGAKHALVSDEGPLSPSEFTNGDMHNIDPENEHENEIAKHCPRNQQVSGPLTPKKRASPSSRQKPTSLLHAALTGGTQGGISKESKEYPILEETPEQGECLTAPHEPKSNKGCDNAEGNLIVHKNDLLKIPNRTIQNHSTEHNSFLNNNDPLGMTTFQVLGLLGQGTFAQVFHCKNMDTGKVCAVKIVKNKPAYTRQATIEIDVFKTMMKKTPKNGSHDMQSESTRNGNASEEEREIKDLMVSLLCYFMHKSHLCLVFELLGQNLYELLKRRQFRGLPVRIVRNVIKQALSGVKELTKRKIVHCDLKPENILVVSDEVTQMMVDSQKNGKKPTVRKDSEETDGLEITIEKSNTIKLIDFGSACFEGSAGFTYIQSRFYRSPEVLVGVQYDSAIDMWSLGCVAAELFLGLPILPGVHELDQLGRIQEMIGHVPEWMLDQGKKSLKYYALNKDAKDTNDDSTGWKLKTREEFATSLSEEELERYGGATKLEQPPANRYFKYTQLHDIVIHHGNCKTSAEKESLSLFVHFLKGLLNPDPCERWTAYQASSHPFITGGSTRRRLSQEKNSINGVKDVNWSPPWDPTVCRRKLSFKQGSLNKPNRRRQSLSRREPPADKITSPNTLRVMNMTGAMSLNNLESQLNNDHNSPPSILNGPPVHPRRTAASSFQPLVSMSMGTLAHEMPNQFYHAERDLNLSLHQQFNTAAPPDIYSNGIHSIPHQQGIPIMTGPQSYSGVYHTGAMGQMAPRGDLGYALQRPGVDPCSSLGQTQQLNQIYLQQHGHGHGHIQPSSLGSLVQASSYNDHLDIPNHYNSMHAMSMPSIQGHGSIPQDYAMHYPSSYQMAYNEANLNHDPSQTARRDQHQTYYPYRGGSM